MSKTFTVLLSLSTSFAAAGMVAAQGAPPPAPQLKKYEVLAGAFTGEGIVRDAPGGDAMPWTSTSTGQWTLGGHVLEERMQVVIGGGAMVIQFQSFFGWDGETGRHVNLGVSNIGPVELQPVHFLSDTEFSIAATRSENGAPVSDTGVYKFGKDGYEFSMQRVDAHGRVFEHVRGTFKRSKTAAASATSEASFVGEATGELGKLSRMLGTWKLDGKMIPAPGAPTMNISGVETEKLGYGGNVIIGHVLGDAIPGMGPAYEAWGFTTWDPDTKTYAYGNVSNMGEIGLVRGVLVGDDQVVFTAATPIMGQPAAARATLTFTADGLTWASDKMIGTAPTVRDFEATYTRKK